MRVVSAAISLAVADPESSAAYLVDNFGFARELESDGFVKVARDDVAVDILFVRIGNPSLPEQVRRIPVAGAALAFQVDDLDREFARLCAAGADILTPLTTHPWGERVVQTRDPNGVTVELVDWKGSSAPRA